jgi:hypothetical protein
MNRIAPAVTASLAVILTLAGCSSAPASDTGKQPDAAPVASASASPEPTETADSEFGETVTSTRGNLVKELGQLAGTSSLTGDVVTSRFAVTDLDLDFACTSGFAEAPANGHYLGIHVNVETTPELAESEFPWISFTAYDWQAYDAEGKRLNDPVANAWSCLDAGDQLPAQIGPGQSVSGWMVLDVAAPSGVVALTMLGSPTGWEWAY